VGIVECAAELSELSALLSSAPADRWIEKLDVSDVSDHAECPRAQRSVAASAPDVDRPRPDAEASTTYERIDSKRAASDAIASAFLAPGAPSRPPKRLRIDRMVATEAVCASLAAAASSGAIVDLELSRCSVCSDALLASALAALAPRLEKLCIAECALGVASCSALTRMSILTHLELSDCGSDIDVGGGGGGYAVQMPPYNREDQRRAFVLGAAAAISACASTLSILTLRSGSAGAELDAAIGAAAGAGGALARATLGGAWVTDDTVAALARGVEARHADLEHLELCCTLATTAAGLSKRAVGAMKRARTLSIRSTPFAKAAAMSAISSDFCRTRTLVAVSCGMTAADVAVMARSRDALETIVVGSEDMTEAEAAAAESDNPGFRVLRS
jgi:hypothetical protein